MRSTIRNVAVIGATGLMGSEISKALVSSGFDVTAIQRPESSNPARSGTRSVKVDLSDTEALMSAFENQDAVVSAAPDPIVLENQKPWIDAAVASGVKRIFPSEYSTNVDSPLISKARNTSSWTSINNGPFFELVLGAGGLGPQFQSKTATYHNGGANLVGATRIRDIAETVAKILRNENGLYEQAENQSVYIHSAVVSEKQLTELAEKVTGQTFAVQNLDVEELYQDAKAKWEKGDVSGRMSFYLQMLYGKGYGGSESFREMSWNKKVGLETMSEAELEESIRNAAKENGLMKAEE
ncbi:Pinoresinol reductase 1-like protein 2 [Colletotrichum chlorophyti]|uniref:Pinoresinol reductase 1-like protein 2 n=1 Tax=Colletotrichum chlorophyti TaxID=708187 RepID=A0A1Q8S978_9PEZI|nr:Pinoresinol reductase 1-like protein 2 [Colletotrichum chlorophyti]